MFFRLVAFSCELQRNQLSSASTTEFLVVRVTEIEGLCFRGICWLSVFLLILFVLALLPWWELNEQKHLQASCFHRPRMDSVESHAHPHPHPRVQEMGVRTGSPVVLCLAPGSVGEAASLRRATGDSAHGNGGPQEAGIGAER